MRGDRTLWWHLMEVLAVRCSLHARKQLMNSKVRQNVEEIQIYLYKFMRIIHRELYPRARPPSFRLVMSWILLKVGIFGSASHANCALKKSTQLYIIVVIFYSKPLYTIVRIEQWSQRLLLQGDTKR